MAKESDIVETEAAKTQNDGENIPEVEQELSKVASNPKQSMFILAGICLVFLYLFYNFFINSGDDTKSTDNLPVPTEVSRPVEISGADIPSIPTLPSPPKLEDPSLPPPPPLQDVSSASALPTADSLEPPIALPDNGKLPLPPGSIAPSLPISSSTSNEEKKARQDQKRKAPIVLVAGSAPTKTPEEVQQEADFKYRGDMNLVLARGKLLDAVVETAISTDFGGEIRAVIVRDVYSEWGKNILIPKGSKIFGNYSQGIDSTYGRIAIEWTRIDLINGYTINFAGTATDALGKKGVQGRVDNKFKERFSNAVLRSAFNIALANVLDSIVEPQINSQAAATQNTQATSIRNLANGTTATTETEATTARLNLCANVLNAITDKTSTAFTTINTACNELQTQTGSSEQEKLTSLKNTINASADSLIQITNASTELSKAQEASEQAFTDLSDKITELVDEQKFTPTITIDQGTRIKIYVNRDYRFPKAAVGRTKMMK